MPKKTVRNSRKEKPKEVAYRNTMKNFFSKAEIHLLRKRHEVPPGTPGAEAGRTGLRSGVTKYYLPDKVVTYQIVPEGTPGSFDIRIKGVDYAVIEKPTKVSKNAFNNMMALGANNLFANPEPYNSNSNVSRRSTRRAAAGAGRRGSSNSSGRASNVDDDIMAAFQQLGLMGRKPAKKGAEEHLPKNYGNY